MSVSKTYLDPNGYRRFKDTNKLVHRWAKEKELGRPLERGEIVHHRNGNKQDNRPENLEKLSAKEHYKIHVVPLLEARKEAQIVERLTPVFVGRAITIGLLGSAAFGAVLLIGGLLIRGKIELWHLGYLVLILSLAGLVIQRRMR